jgi:CrcB protein
MIEAKNILLVVAGSATGGVLRYLLTVYFIAKEWNRFPWATFSVNMLGCFIIGVVYALTEKTSAGNHPIRLLLTTGFCGGFTTFSAFAYENLQLLKIEDSPTALIYIGLSVILGIGATFLGIFLFK